MENANALRLALVAVAAGEVGTREAGGNNRGADIVQYQRATWLAPDAWPWCAAFVAWCLKRALETPGGVEYMRANHLAPESFRCKDASAFGWLKWAAKQGLEVFDEHSGSAIPGDIVVFDFSHIGIVEKAQRGTIIECIEGNTNGRGDRDSTSGDGVWRKTRDVKLVRGYIRL